MIFWFVFPHDMKVLKVTYPGARLRKKDEGMPSLTDNNQRGTLYVTFDVEFPKTELTPEQKKQIIDILQQDNVKPKVYNGLQGF